MRIKRKYQLSSQTVDIVVHHETRDLHSLHLTYKHSISADYISIFYFIPLLKLLSKANVYKSLH